MRTGATCSSRREVTACIGGAPKPREEGARGLLRIVVCTLALVAFVAGLRSVLLDFFDSSFWGGMAACGVTFGTSCLIAAAIDRQILPPPIAVRASA